MAALKQSLTALTLAILVMVGAGTAAAQDFPAARLGIIECDVSSATPLLRAEGLTERVGDIILSCSNDWDESDDYESHFLANLEVEIRSAQITNNYVDESDDVIDAVLVVNNNHCDTPSETGGVYESSCDTVDPFTDEVQIPQYGILDSDGIRAFWDAVELPVPGGPINPGAGNVEDSDFCGDTEEGWDYENCHPLTTTVRITSLRVNASQVAPDGSNIGEIVDAQVFVEGVAAATRVTLSDEFVDVGRALTSLDADIDGDVAGLQCFDFDREEEPAVEITLRELFETAFKEIGEPATDNYYGESGYYADSENEDQNGGGVTNATEFVLSFTDIPDGVTINVPSMVYCDGGDTVLQRLTDSEVDLSGGAGEAIYEVYEGDNANRETCTITAYVEWDANIPDIGSGSVTVGYHPAESGEEANIASVELPEPRFRADSLIPPHSFVTTEKCTTTLLFPFVTNQAGFDTGIAISNTSEDWLGTEPQDGSCTIHYIGERLANQDPVEDQTSEIILGGDQLVFTISGGAPAQGIDPADGFQGFLIASCEFQYAHGFAFITDGFGGIPALAQGYLALVIPLQMDGDRLAGVPEGLNGALHVYGETLGQ